MNAVEALLTAHIRDARDKIRAATQSVDALEKLAERLIAAPMPLPVPRQRGIDGWSRDEEDTLKFHYAAIGAVGCHELMRHRSVGAIRSRACRLGLTTLPSARRFWCDQCSARVTPGQVAACQSKFCKGKEVVAAERLNA